MNSAKQINILRKSIHQPVWHRNYFERVIRDDTELAHIRAYIRDNTVKWALDEENPQVIRRGERPYARTL